VLFRYVREREKGFRANSEKLPQKKAWARVFKLLWKVEVCSLTLELADNGHEKFRLRNIFAYFWYVDKIGTLVHANIN
jgi:hypothetical protein